VLIARGPFLYYITREMYLLGNILLSLLSNATARVGVVSESALNKSGPAILVCISVVPRIETG
jgi:hypothetical protein